MAATCPVWQGCPVSCRQRHRTIRYGCARPCQSGGRSREYSIVEASRPSILVVPQGYRPAQPEGAQKAAGHMLKTRFYCLDAFAYNDGSAEQIVEQDFILPRASRGERFYISLPGVVSVKPCATGLLGAEHGLRAAWRVMKHTMTLLCSEVVFISRATPPT